MNNIRNIEDIASKMRLMGDNVEILTDNTLIQTPKDRSMTSIYSLIDNKLLLKCKYKEINRVYDSNICVTKSALGKCGLVDLAGKPIIRPGYKEIDYSNRGILIVTLENGLKSILDYKGYDLLPYTMSSVKTIETSIGNVLKSTTHKLYADLMLIEYNGEQTKLIRLDAMNNQIKDRNYILNYDTAIIFDYDGTEKHIEWRNI